MSFGEFVVWLGLVLFALSIVMIKIMIFVVLPILAIIYLLQVIV